MFDFHKNDKDHPFYCNKITYVLRIFKIETPDTKFEKKFCVFSSKAYAFIKPNQRESKIFEV